MDNIYNIKGIIISNNIPLPGVIVNIEGNTTYSNLKGEFNINGNYENIFNISLSLEGFETKVFVPFDSNQIPRTDLGVINMTPIKDSTKNDITKAGQFKEEDIKSLVKVNTTFESIQQKKLNNLLVDIQTRLLPYVITLISKFGVTNLEKVINEQQIYIKTCPVGLLDIVNKKNKLVKQLNNIYKTIDAVTKALGIISGFLTVIEAASILIPLIPLPSPPAVPILYEKLLEQIKKYNRISVTTLVVLNIIKSNLLITIKYLGFLDTLILDCSKELGVDNLVFEQLNEDLLKIELQTPNPTISQINGFIMGVETENTTNTLKRKRAFAKNSQGVVLLLGEWSYSSIEQILIDELAYYIQVNDLKAT
jgi:hypothetical protein